MEGDTEPSSPSVRRLQVWEPPGVQRFLTMSGSYFVGVMEDGRSVLKYPKIMSQEIMQGLYEEAARLKVLGTHENLVVFKGVEENGLVFEYCERGDLEDVIRYQPPLSDVEKTEISRQITTCLVYLHGCNFIHCDLAVRNVFLTSAMVAKVGDIQGQLYNDDGTIRMPAMSQENPQSRHPHAGEDEFTQRTDIFALGTLLYYLWHGQPPFPDLSEYFDGELIQAKYRRGEFPIDPCSDGIDKIISKCWNSCYTQAVEVLKDIEALNTMRSD